jgi:tetratricopeptide (TPR) repeat protein
MIVSAPGEWDETFRAARVALERYGAEQDIETLDAALAAWETVLEHPDFATAPADIRSRAFHTVFDLRFSHYRARHDPSDLAAAVAAGEQAAAAQPPDAPGLSQMLAHVGAAALGDSGTLDRAIALAERAVSLTPADSPDLWIYLELLGKAIARRYNRDSSPDDLDRSIDAFASALRAAGSAGLPGFAAMLGEGLHERFVRTRNLDDLRAAIELGEQAVEATPADAPHRPVLLVLLAQRCTALVAATTARDDLLPRRRSTLSRRDSTRRSCSRPRRVA